MNRSLVPIDVSIIIVNWNSREFLAQCLGTIFAMPRDLEFEIIVIDNASYDGSEQMVRDRFPTVIFIQGRENLGFARANNAAAVHATGRNLLFLNPDTEVVGTAIERMVRFLDARPNAGAVGCKLLNTDGSLQTSCVQAFPTVLNQVLDSALLQRTFPRSSLWGTQAFFDEHAAPAEVEALSGACLLVRRETSLAVGHFTEDYFMYAEDIDLCFKLQKAGHRNYYLGDVCVIHHGGQSSGASSESQFGNVLMRESIAKFLRRHRGADYALAYRIALAFTALARLATLGLARVLGLGLYKPKLVNSGLRKWSSVLRWTIGAEAWVRNPGARPS
jgi:GT2 family glycosyltransferase